jgi:hypothetical protein
MYHLQLLEMELTLMLDNIKRIKSFAKDNKGNPYNLYNSNVVGEIKHRAVALKQTLTLVSKITTNELLK